MLRNRFAWHLFVTATVAVVTLMVGCYWLASLGLARLADEAAFQEMTALATGLADVLPDLDDAAQRQRFEEVARGLTRPSQLVFEVLDRQGQRLAGSLSTATAEADSSDRWPEQEWLVAEAIAGRPARSSRYDVTSGNRIFAVAVPVGLAQNRAGVLRVSADSQEADRVLSESLRRLLLGSLAAGALALVVAWVVAQRLARPLGDLSAGVTQVAAGEAAPLVGSDIAELAAIVEAVTRLRNQLVERGLTIDRRDTEQEAVLDSMIEGVLAVDVRQRIVGINQAAAGLLQVDIDAVLRRPIQEVIRNPEIRRFVLQAIDCREPVEDDFVLSDPVSRIFHGRGTALRDPSGEGGAVIVFNDVTELERLESIRRDFVANVSHELKTPVATIKGFVETLLDGAIDEPADNRRFLEIVGRQSDRLAAIIEDLLALSRIEQSEGAGSLPREPVAVASLLAAARSSCLPRATERGMAIELDCPDELVAEVNAALLEQAVLNLIDNAIKYSGTEKPIHVQATAEAIPGQAGLSLVISIRDEGNGIPAEHLPRLFERFYRVDKGRSRQVGGTGLGLSIVKHIVQAHGGTIAVVSERGQGSTFTMKLPLAGTE
jgi:two-component system phosphate regulon sensor histidine kinase PhoR